VIIGFFFGIEGEVNLSRRGAFYGISSSVFASLYSVTVKKVIGLLDRNEYLLIEYNTPIAILTLTPVVWLSGEFSVLFESRSVRFWCIQTLVGVVGFVINIASFLCIKYTTPLTHTLAGTAKACLQTLLAFVFFKGSEHVTVLKSIGLVLVIGFTGVYATVRRAEMKTKIIKLLDNTEKSPEDEKQLIGDEEARPALDVSDTERSTSENDSNECATDGKHL
jgi:GDP-fucose transporter C1